MVTIGGNKQMLEDGDILLINQSHVHEVVGLTSNIIATFLIPMHYLKDHVQGIDQIYFNSLNGHAPKSDEAYEWIRRLLAEIVQLKYKKGTVYQLDMQVRLLSVFTLLMKRFTEKPVSGAMNEKYKDRMLRIITYIDDHYKESITLQGLADLEFLSVPYLSKFFSENIGLNFQSYLTSIRLKHAVEELLRDDYSAIADIAFEHGFPNAKSFYAAFKSKYHLTPNEYRKEYEQNTAREKRDFSTSYTEFNQSSALSIIEEYVKQPAGSIPNSSIPSMASLTTVSGTADLLRPGKPIRHTWKNLITIGKAKEGLHADVQQHLRYVQLACPFRYVRFHGIFDDDMRVYDEVLGEPRYHFRLIDQLFDFLLSIGLKPFVELGFMPSQMAADPGQTVFYDGGCVSPPTSNERWCELIGHFVRHCLDRYGLQEVSQWRFEFWNEPELDYFWPGTEEQYMEMYLGTYQTIKSISDRLQVGAPGRLLTVPYEGFAARFFQRCKENNATPDFIPVHYYPIIANLGLKQKRETEEHDDIHIKFQDFTAISGDPNYLNKLLLEERDLLKKNGLHHLPVHMTEWNSTSDHRELTNDTLYKAAYLAKNITENLDLIDSFGYWVLSDNIEEHFADKDLFHGGMGLITQYGIPKAAMRAYELLAKLGNLLMEQKEGYIVTSGNGEYQMLTYNYCHFDELFTAGDHSLHHLTSRYHRFKDEKTLKIELVLTGMPKGKYRVTRTKITKQQGSPYDAWVEMGAPEVLHQEDLEYLKARSTPERCVEIIEVTESTLLTSLLEPHSVELIELKPVFKK